VLTYIYTNLVCYHAFNYVFFTFRFMPQDLTVIIIYIQQVGPRAESFPSFLVLKLISVTSVYVVMGLHYNV